MAGRSPKCAGPPICARYRRRLSCRHMAITMERAGNKNRLLTSATVLLFPTYYAAETQGLVVAEALAHDLPVITTRWRAVPENLPASRIYLVEPRSPAALAAALAAEALARPTEGRLRAHFLTHCTAEIFSRQLATHLLALKSPVDLGPRDRSGTGRPG